VGGARQRITLADGRVLEIDVRLSRAGVITGEVVDEFGVGHRRLRQRDALPVHSGCGG
jgi:hypothetical protein